MGLHHAILPALLLTLCGARVGAAEAPCEVTTHEDRRYTICTIDPAEAELRLFLNDPEGAPLGQFGAVEAALPEGETLAFAMNGGMYHDDRRPVGLYIEDGEELAPLVTQEGPGNFGLLPNGVFCIGEDSAQVIETMRYAEAPPACRHATQSGPMLVIDGELHPRFLVDSTSRYIRNGVGTSDDGRRVVFAISERPVTFHEFGRLFRDHLELDQALYFDGNVSRLHAPGLGRSDIGRYMGPIVGLVDTVP